MTTLTDDARALSDEIVTRLLEVHAHGYSLPGDLVGLLDEWIAMHTDDESGGKCGEPDCECRR